MNSLKTLPAIYVHVGIMCVYCIKRLNISFPSFFSSALMICLSVYISLPVLSVSQTVRLPTSSSPYLSVFFFLFGLEINLPTWDYLQCCWIFLPSIACQHFCLAAYICLSVSLSVWLRFSSLSVCVSLLFSLPAISVLQWPTHQIRILEEDLKRVEEDGRKVHKECAEYR